MVLPRSAGTFLISRVAISWSEAAVSTSRTISLASSSRIVSRCFRVQRMLRPPRVLRSPRGRHRRARGQGGAVDLGDLGGEPLRERDATGAEADEGEVGGAAVLLEDLVGDAGEGPVERRFVENLGLLSEARYGGGHLLSLRASRGSLKGKCTSYGHSTGGGPSLSTRGSASEGRSF